MTSSTVRADEDVLDEAFARGLPDSDGAFTVAQPVTSTPAVREAANKNECEILFNSTTQCPLCEISPALTIHSV
jgi:hypothetical protein